MMSNRLTDKIAKRLRLPLIAAPMLSVSGPDLAIAACKAGVIGSFPLANARTIEGVDAWLTQIKSDLARAADENADRPTAPFCPNLIIKRAQMRDELQALVKHRVEMVITSVGSPAEAIKPLHDVGCIVFADVATLHHTERAIAAGVDGLILLTAGAGGQTGWLNPLAFVRSVRAMFDGPIVLAGGISDGHALWAAEVLGCDLAYMGTKFIATHESMARLGDGKTLRGSFDKFNDRAAAQVLSAFATDTALVLAHLDIAAKSNEIPAAQTLLAELGVAAGAIVTLDALHCQKNTLKSRHKPTSR